MSSFEKLRLGTGASVLGVLASVCGASRSARAATAPTPVAITTAGAKWANFSNSNTGPSGVVSFGSGFAMTDGSLTGPARSDAFDGAMMCRINGTTFLNPGGNVDVSTVAGGRKVTSNAATIGSLQARMTYYASGTKPVLRAICSVTNPTGAPVAVTLQVGSNLGSDSSTLISTTSSGDAVVDGADRWFISSDAGSPGRPGGSGHGKRKPDVAGSSDPVLLMARYGTGAAALPALIDTPGAGNDNFVDQYTFTLAPGQTSSIMQLAWLNLDTASAATNSPNFNSTSTLLSAGLLADLSSGELSQIINYGPVGPASVPTMGKSATWLAAFLLGASALWQLVRRRRKSAPF